MDHLDADDAPDNAASSIDLDQTVTIGGPEQAPNHGLSNPPATTGDTDDVIIDLTGDEPSLEMRTREPVSASVPTVERPTEAVVAAAPAPVRPAPAPTPAPVQTPTPAPEPQIAPAPAPQPEVRRQPQTVTPDEPATSRRWLREPLEARRVYRIIRRVDGWSVLKVSVIFYFCLWLVLMTAGVILWSGAVQSGTIDNVENLIATLLGFETFAFEGETLFRVALFGGLTAAVAATAITVLMAILFNLISDLTGGIRVTVIQEESARRRIR